ncbi:hypothetical protein QBC39DRAFT_149476 [Podospora conica]|nr:hypothetical protein QBC39DRAFT_149476 [Schizothecium conicum]
MASEPPRYSYSQAPAARPPSPPTPTWPTTQQWTGHRYQSVQHDSSHDLPPPPSPPSPSSSSANRYSTAHVETPATSRATEPADLPWRPFYLRRTVLAFCAVVFSLILVAVEALLAYSNKHQGIGNGNSNQHYLWTYGPTAILTLVAAFWSRVEFQSKMVAPWIRIGRGPSQPKQGLLLDYLSDFQPWSIVKGFRNRDFVVSITTTISILIKIMIIISTGLISLSLTPVVDDSFPMVLQDRFVDEPARLESAGPLAWYYMRGLIDGNLTHPEGYWSDYAFQSVRRADFPDAALTRVVVDGLKNDLECLPATALLTGSHPPDPRNATWTANVTVTAPGCKINNLRLRPPNMPRSNREKATVQFARLVTTQCDGTTSDEGKRIFVMAGNLTYVKDTSHSFPSYNGANKDYDYFTTLHQSAQFLCTPIYHISQVEVVSNGTRTISVTPVPDAPKRTLNSITAWAVMEAQLRAFSTSDAIGMVVNPYGEGSIQIPDGTSTVQVDANLYAITALQSQLPPNATLQHIYEGTLLRDVATGYHRQISSALAKMAITAPASIETTGTMIVNTERLVIRGWATHWMAGLLGTCILLTLVASLLVPTRGILPCSPSGFLGLASVLQNSPDLTGRLRHSGASDKKELLSLLQGTSFRAGFGRDSASNQPSFSITNTRSDLSGIQGHPAPTRSPHTHPAIIHPASRASLLIVLAGLIVALELMLRKSDKEQGLGDVGDDTFVHYTWTALPALVLGSLALVLSAMDFRTRCLAPYATLLRPTSTKTLMVLDFLDMSVPRAMYRAATLKNLGVLATTLAFLTSSLFTIFSASLFQALTVPATGQIALQANMSFDLEPEPFLSDKTPTVMASMIFEGNMTYPSHTYEDLAYPMLISTSLTLPNTSRFDTSSARVSAVVPAVRARLQCRFYDMSEIETNHTRGVVLIGDRNPLGVRIKAEYCGTGPRGSLFDDQYDALTSTLPNTTYFGIVNDPGPYNPLCSDLLYAWGKLDYAAEQSILYVAAMACNSTLERVDVNTTYIGTSLQIDPDHPPQPLEETARLSTLPSNVSLDYTGLAGPPTPNGGIPPFFSVLTTSRWAIPMESLGDPAARDAVGEAIKFQHAIIQAQILRWHMGPANATNATLSDPGPGENDSQPVYLGEIRDVVARRRVVMDAASTRVLQGLLGAALVFVVVGWVFMRKTTVLAASPTSIAARAALVAGGNLVEMLPSDAARRTSGEVAAALGKGTKFRLEWRAEGGALLEGAEGEAPYHKGAVSRYGVFGKRDGYQ